jgi:hypothetical protein
MALHTTIQQTSDAMGELFIWTDVDPAHEQDFNRWYDTEHMQERAAIPGFKWSRRYHSKTCTRPYLALYRTESLKVFTTDTYRQAFTKQTEWSVRNFSRMHNTQRRVAAVTLAFGAGTGAGIALVSLGSVAIAEQALAQCKMLGQSAEGILSAKILTPDTTLSTPLPSESKEQRILEPYLIIDATSVSEAAKAATAIAKQLGLPATAVHSFDLLWDLQSSDL